MILLVGGSLVFSLFAIFILYACATGKMEKYNVAYAVMLVLVVVITVMTKQPAFFGLSVVPALLMITHGRKNANK